MIDVQELIDGIHGYVTLRLKPIMDRVKAMESRPIPQPGCSADDVRGIVAEAIQDIPPAKDGKSVAVEDVLPALTEAAQAAAREAVAALPAPLDGKSVAAEDVMPALMARLDDAIAAIPAPKDGKGVTVDDFRALFEAEQAKWELALERRAAEILQHAIDRMPAPKDGVDGLGFDDFSVSDDGDGTVTLRFARGDVVKEHVIRLPRFCDKGVFREGVGYRKGDGVTFGGSFWLAQKDDPEGKPGLSDDWRLAVKRGRDGKRP